MGAKDPRVLSTAERDALFPDGFDPRQVGALPRRPRLPAPGRRVLAPAQAGAGGFPSVELRGDPLACGHSSLRQSDPANVHWTFAFGSFDVAPPSPTGNASTSARCLAASRRPQTGTKASPRCSGTDASQALLIFACCPSYVSLRRISFLADLTRVKSARACLPLAGALPRQPRQARADFQAWSRVETPLPAGLRPSAIGPGKRPLDVCFRVL